MCVHARNTIYTEEGSVELSFEDEETPDILSCYSWIQFQDGHAMSMPTKQSTGRPDKKGKS